MTTEDQLQSVFEGVSNVLKLQINLSAPDDGWQFTEDLVTNEFLGYIFGFVDGVQQVLNVNEMETKIEMLAAVMVTLLGEEVGAASTQKAIKIQRNHDFDMARKLAGKQALAFIRDKTTPMGLSHILFGHPLDKVYGPDSKIREDNK